MTRDASPTPLLELIKVTRAFPGIVALDRVSLDLRPGEVHALVGENGAGKSTLISLVSGILQPDSGQILLRGAPVLLDSAVAARRLGVVTVHQETELFPHLSIAENLALEHGLPSRAGWVDWRAVERSAREVVAALAEPVDVRQPAARLSVGQRQMLQVATAVLRRADVVILDEPTSSLSVGESDWLFARIRRLRAAGAGIIYISHRQDEIFALADRITILRDGRRVWSGSAADIDRAQLVRHMVGRELARPAARRASPATLPRLAAPSTDSDSPRLQLRGVTDVAGRFADIDLDIHAGEIVGLYGLVGAGRSELAQAIFGLAPRAAGHIAVDGVEVDLRSPADAVAHGIAYLPEDRLRQGALRGLSVQANAVLSNLRAYTRGGVVDRRREAAATARQAEALGVRMRSAAQPLGELSGGNQQKVILARWLLTAPRVLILDEPTRGIDVAAKAEIHELLAHLAEQGVAILLITSDLPEALAVSQRLVVARRGRLVAEFDPATAAEEVTQAALPDAQFREEPSAATTKQRRAPRGDWGLMAAIIALGAALTATTPQFLAWQNLAGVVSEAAVWTILALAAATVILAGAIDISLGSLLALAAGVSGMMLRDRVGGAATVPLALSAGLGVGVLGGLLNAALALGGRVHPIVITLGTMTAYRGLLILLTGGDTIGDLPPTFGRLATAKFAGVEAAVVWLVAASVLTHVGLTHSVLGRYLVAYGNSPSAARLVGISQRRAWLSAFAASGLLTGAAGLLSLARAGQMQSGLGAGYELQAIAAAVIGGVSITGGRGSVLGVALGALLLSLLYNALVLWQVSVYRYDLVIGGLLLAAVVLDRLWRRWSE